MNLHTFHREFEKVPKEDKFIPIETRIEPTSLFVIFKQLEGVRAQKKYFEDREAHLLALAELGFKQLQERTNGKPERT